LPREPQRILGIDAALRMTGFGAVEASGSAIAGIEHGVIANPAARPVAECLLHLRRRLLDVIERVRPAAAAVEGVFYCRNPRTSISLGAARGAVLIACAESGLPVYEYTAREIKQSVTGRGSATKEQVARMVVAMLGLAATPAEDATDALAAAICHVNHATVRSLGLDRILTAVESDREGGT